MTHGDELAAVVCGLREEVSKLREVIRAGAELYCGGEADAGRLDAWAHWVSLLLSDVDERNIVPRCTRGAERGKVKERFGERIRRIRTEQKLGLREFALKVGISPTYLSRIETAEEKAPPAEDVIRKMASQLSDSFDELMTLAGRVSEASLDVIKADSKMPEFLRTVGERKLSAEDLMKLLPSEPKKGKR